MSRRTFGMILVWVLLVPVLLGGLVWLNLRLVALNPQDAFFASYWVGTRAFLFKGQSPYTEAIAQETQRQVYGRLARSDEYAFMATYPLFATFVFAPFALVNDVALARAAWMTALELALLATLWFCLRITRWQPPGWLVFACGLFALAWAHGLLPLVNGDVVILAGLFGVLALSAVRAERYELAGILLAFTALQMLPLLLAVVLILIWGLSRRQWALPLFFFGTLALLIVTGMFFQPQWPVDFLRVILRYPVYPTPNTLGAALAIWWPGVGRQVGWVLTALLSLVLLAEWGLALRRDFRWMLWTCCLTLVLSAWVGIPTSPMAFTLLLLPLVLVFATWEGRAPLAGRVLAIILLLSLAGGLWPLLWNGRAAYPWPQIPPGLFLPAPLVLVVMLYWVRWWATRPRRFYEELNALESS